MFSSKAADVRESLPINRQAGVSRASWMAPCLEERSGAHVGSDAIDTPCAEGIELWRRDRHVARHSSEKRAGCSHADPKRVQERLV